MMLRALSRSMTLLISDRKSTRLNSSHLVISYAVFCLKKKKNATTHAQAIHPVPRIPLAFGSFSPNRPKPHPRSYRHDAESSDRLSYDTCASLILSLSA